MENMTVLESMAAVYWDMYKDAYGIRPRGVNTDDWTVQDFQRELQNLGRIITQQEAAREIEEQENVLAIEKSISVNMSVGAKTRRQAIEWLLDSVEVDGDLEYACYKFGIPYGYFNKDFV